MKSEILRVLVKVYKESIDDSDDRHADDDKVQGTYLFFAHDGGADDDELLVCVR